MGKESDDIDKMLKDPNVVETGCKEWMSKREVKLMLSMLPGSTQPPELLSILLESCFEAGMSQGAKVIALSLMSHMKSSEGK